MERGCSNFHTMESIFSFPLSYFSFIFLVKGKCSKSISFFLCHIGPKRSCQSAWRIFISNVFLEKSEKIAFFYACWYHKLRVGRKILLFCNNEWMKWTDFLHIDANSGKLKITLIIFGWSWSKLDIKDSWFVFHDFS